MSQCAPCGEPTKSRVPKIVLWCVGLCFAAIVGLPILVILLLVVIAAIGASANNQATSVEGTQAQVQYEAPAPAHLVSEQAQPTETN